jgi:hypothetical protein
LDDFVQPRRTVARPVIDMGVAIGGGGGICGLSLALNLKERGIDCPHL